MASVPGSKSESNRALLLASLGDAPSTLSGLLTARDTDLMIAALRSLSVRIDHLTDPEASVRVHPPERFTPVPDGIDCGLAGTVMRFVPPLAALAGGRTRFFGDARAEERPMGPLLAGLSQLGVTFDADRLPFTIDAPARLGGPLVQIDSSSSSQFISALLLSAALLPEGIDLIHTGSTLPSMPHIEMTVAMLRERGVQIDDSRPGRWRVLPGPIAAHDQRIEPDLTNAAVFLAAGLISGGHVTVPGWPEDSVQPGRLFTEVAARMGAIVELTDNGLIARAPAGLHGAQIDLHEASELTPVIAALAVFTSGTTTISGVAHIRGHETDRLAAIEAELASLGVDLHQTDDGLIIQGVGDRGEGLAPTRVLRAYADHRMAHLAAVVGLVVPGVQLDEIDSVSKTMPDFALRWQQLLDQVQGPL